VCKRGKRASWALPGREIPAYPPWCLPPTLGYTPPLQPYLRVWFKPVMSLGPRCAHYGQHVHDPGCGNYTFSPGVEEESLLWVGKVPSSPQNKPLSPAETARKRPRNPAQKALLHKDDENLSTPPEVLSGPPQGKTPPFLTAERTSQSPLVLPGFEHFRTKKLIIPGRKRVFSLSDGKVAHSQNWRF